jgi:hypothetical protein
MITILTICFFVYISKDVIDGYTSTDYIIMAILAHSIVNEISMYRISKYINKITRKYK